MPEKITKESVEKYVTYLKERALEIEDFEWLYNQNPSPFPEVGDSNSGLMFDAIWFGEGTIWEESISQTLDKIRVARSNEAARAHQELMRAAGELEDHLERWSEDEDEISRHFNQISDQI